MAGRLARYESEVRRNERFRVAGQLGAGMAHQLRNAATGGRMAIELHQRSCPVASADESLEVALRQLRVMETYLKRFLSLGAAPMAIREEVAVRDVIEDTLAVVRPACAHAGSRSSRCCRRSRSDSAAIRRRSASSWSTWRSTRWTRPAPPPARRRPPRASAICRATKSPRPDAPALRRGEGRGSKKAVRGRGVGPGAAARTRTAPSARDSRPSGGGWRIRGGPPLVAGGGAGRVHGVERQVDHELADRLRIAAESERLRRQQRLDLDPGMVQAGRTTASVSSITSRTATSSRIAVGAAPSDKNRFR